MEITKNIKTKKTINSENLLLETKLSSIISTLSLENLPQNKKEELEKEYKKIMKIKKDKI